MATIQKLEAAYGIAAILHGDAIMLLRLSPDLYDGFME